MDQAPAPLFQDDLVTVWHADSRDLLPHLPADSFHSAVCDPPYHLQSIVSRFSKEGAAPASTALYRRLSGGFMGKKWDGGDIAFDPAFWAEVLRVLRPGGYLLAFGGTRTHHRVWCASEDAGFEVHDTISWWYSEGFPKAHNLSKQMDKMAGAERKVVGTYRVSGNALTPTSAKGGTYGVQVPNSPPGDLQITAPATEEAKYWEGWRTPALRPSWEPIVLARKPISESSVARNALRHGTGGVNIDACRFGDEVRVNQPAGNKPGGISLNLSVTGMPQDAPATEVVGRWPANVLLDEGAAEALDEQHPGASLFFYVVKVKKRERHGTTHPTAKPVELLRYLVRLVTVKGGEVLDPFAGSGTTRLAALAEGCKVTLIEKDKEYADQLVRRHAKLALDL
jgi:DNA modification methylase